MRPEIHSPGDGNHTPPTPEERGVWWWLLIHEQTTLRERIAARLVCAPLGHRWEYYRGDWEPDANAYNPATASRSCSRCNTYEPWPAR